MENLWVKRICDSASFLNSFLWYSGCTAVGFDKSSSYRYIQVAGEYTTAKSFLHLLFHVLGRYHEHQREDRDKYVHIIREHVIEGINNHVNITQSDHFHLSTFKCTYRLFPLWHKHKRQASLNMVKSIASNTWTICWNVWCVHVFLNSESPLFVILHKKFSLINFLTKLQTINYSYVIAVYWFFFVTLRITVKIKT